MYMCRRTGNRMRVAIMQREEWGRIDHWFWRGGGGYRWWRAFDFQRAVDLCCLPSTICIPLRVSEVVGVLVLLFQVIHRALIVFVKILTMCIQCMFIEVAAVWMIMRVSGATPLNYTKLGWTFGFTKFQICELAYRNLLGIAYFFIDIAYHPRIF